MTQTTGQPGTDMPAPSSPGWARLGDPLALAGLFVGAFLVRLVYLLEARGVPLFHHLISDGRAYVDWADAIRAGDLWSRSQQVFYQAPLYAYLLAAIRGLFGDDLWAIRLCQSLAGAAACVLLVIAGRRWFDPRTGWVAGIALALYAPAIFLDGVINKASFALLAAALFVALLGNSSEQTPRLTWAGTGLALGLLVLLRENALLLVPVVLAWLWTLPHREPAARRRIATALVFLTGLAVALLPVALRNLAVGGTFTLTTVQAGPNLWIGNNPTAEGTYRPLVPGRSDTPFERADAVLLAERAEGRELTSREVSRYWSRRALSYVRSEPVDWLRLTARKSWMVLHRYEQPDAEDFALYASRSRLLQVLAWPGHYGVLIPLAVFGAILSWPNRQRMWPLAACAAVLLGGVALFFVFARYRHPALPPLLLLASAGATGLMPAWHGSRRRFGVAAGVGLIAACIANAPLDFGQRANQAMALNNLGAALAGEGRLQEASTVYRDALTIDPRLVEGQLNLGSTLWALEQRNAAITHLEAAYRLSPEDPDIARQLGLALTQQRSLARAEPVLRQARLLLPDDLQILRTLAWVLSEQKNFDEAIRLALIACIQTDYRDSMALRIAVASYLATNRPLEAKTVAEKAVKAAETRGEQRLAEEIRAAMRAF